MTFTIFYSLLVAILGAVVYAMAPDTRPKLKELGRITFAAGMFAFCFQLGSERITGGTP